MEKDNEKKPNGMGIASLVLGISSIILPLPFIPFIMGIVGICLAVKQRKIHPNGIATAGLVLSIIGVSLWGIIIFIFIAMFGLVGITMGGLW